MKKEEIRLLEHNLIPLALVAANFCLAHLFYLVSIYRSVTYGEFFGVILSLTIIVAGIYLKHKFLLITSVLFYLITLIIALAC